MLPRTEFVYEAIADLVADLRAATPSAAAELVSPDMLEIEAQVERARQRLVKTVSQNLKQHTRELEQLRRRLISEHGRTWQLRPI